MPKALVSVCINVYNAEKYITKTIESVINQTYKNLQIIVIDDCSTDNTYNIVKSIDDPRIEVYKLPFNCHISNACNEGFKYVKGEYVAHLDADDLWTPDKIEKQVSFLENNKNYGACFTHAEIIDDNGDIAGEDQDFLRNVYAFDNCSQAQMLRYFYDNANRLCHPSSLIKTEIINKVGKHDTSMLYLHDFDYWMRLLTVTHLYVIPERLTLVRRHEDNNSDMSDAKWIAHDTEMVRLIYKSINMCPDDLFLEAFSDKLRFVGEHTHEDVEIEKALMLLEGTITFKDNPILGLYKFSNLFSDKKYIEIAKEKFNFTTRDLYKFQQNQSYFSPKKNAELIDSLNQLTELNQELNAVNISVNTANENLNNTNKELQKINEDLNAVNVNVNRDNERLNNSNIELQRINEELNTVNININRENEILCKANGELDSANNELKVINEKLTKTNEDLNMTNEELVVANEELVVANEELHNTNNQLNELNQSLNDNVDILNSHVANLNSVVSDLRVEVVNYSNRLFEIQNSFFWKLTSPFRFVINKIKSFAQKHERLLLILIYFKGFLRGGFKNGKRRVNSYLEYAAKVSNIAKVYEDALALYVTDEVRNKEQSKKFEKNIKFSILVPLYNTPMEFLKEMIQSVQSQTYENWELCLADGSDKKHDYVGKYCLSLQKTDRRIKYKKLKNNNGIAENTNECLKMAKGDYIALFDHDDILHPSALFEYASVINDKNADFIYCDEATFTHEEGEGMKVVLKHFKPEFSPDTLRSYNYICHFTCFAKELYDIVGGFNNEYDGSQDYDMILRLTEKAKKIVRVPKLLYYWRSHKASVASDSSAKPYVVDSAKRALAAHLERVSLKGWIEDAKVPTTYKMQYEIEGNPLVSIIIPNKDHTDDLDKCLRSVYEKSTYKNIEVVVVENNSVETKTFKYYKKAEKKYNNLKVITWDGGFNYSAINNFAAKQIKGEYILLLNNDIEVISPDWLEQMLMFAQRKDVGAVGAKLYYDDDTIQHAGVIIGLGGVAGHSHKYFARNDPGYMARSVIIQNLSACTAACLLMRKEVFCEVEGLDEGFAVAFNDVDLCMKIRKAGYLIVFTPYAEFYHYESKSRGPEDSPEKIIRFNREINRFKDRWSKELEAGDPYYNPNLTLDREDFSPK